MEETKICEEKADNKLVSRPGQAPEEDITTNEVNWETDHFHRHCQKTVCSAFGYDGNGATWSLIGDNSFTLPNLSKICSNWKHYFTCNRDNITEDLKTILELIDKVATGIGSEITLKFLDCSTPAVEVSEKTINPL